MFSDSLLVPQTLIKPRSFAGLMSLYESNFIRLLNLVPDLMTIDGEQISQADSDVPLHLQVLDRTRYTCTIKLTYFFTDDDALLADPDLRLRIYFDGRLAEVMSLTSNHRHAVLRDIAASHREELDLRWRRNMMLNKWLDYCLDCGHKIYQQSSQ